MLAREFDFSGLKPYIEEDETGSAEDDFMLVQFTVENFLSFRAETTFSMVAVSADSRHLNHVVPEVGGGERGVLRTAAIYGANAAGKSNLFKAIQFARDVVLHGTQEGQPLPVMPFKFGDCAHQPSRFEFIFTLGESLYAYGFVLDARQIREEWLYVTRNGEELPCFERTTSETEGQQMQFGSLLTGNSRPQEQFLELLARTTGPHQLFLTQAAAQHIAELQRVQDWFWQDLLIIPAESQHRDLEISVYADSRFTEFMGAFLKAAGTGIEGIVTEEETLDFDRRFPQMPTAMREGLIAELAEAGPNAVLALQVAPSERVLFRRDASGEIRLVQIKTQHRAPDGQVVNFRMEEESEGTQRLIHLIPAIFGMRQGGDRVVLLDELDRRLHPLLSRLLIEVALDSPPMSHSSQFIFTTHDTNLLDLDLLRRDEIWFVQKDAEGASHLASLAEFKLRPDLKIEQGYLNGRFGGIPILRTVADLTPPLPPGREEV